MKKGVESGVGSGSEDGSISKRTGTGNPDPIHDTRCYYKHQQSTRHPLLKKLKNDALLPPMATNLHTKEDTTGNMDVVTLVKWLGTRPVETI